MSYIGLIDLNLGRAFALELNVAFAKEEHKRVRPLGKIIYLQPRLDWIAWALATGRVLACAMHAYYTMRVLPYERDTLAFRGELLKRLCVSDRRMTVSNGVSRYKGFMDRLLIGAIVSASAVAYYAVL